MSMEIYVLSSRRLVSITDWQRSIDALGVVMRLSTLSPFAALRGALAAEFPHTASTFECDHWDVADIRLTYPDVDFDCQWTCALAFRWGADLDAASAAYIAAAGYARAVSGIVFDCEEGVMITPQRAVEIADQLKNSKPMIEAAVRNLVQRLKQDK